MDSLVQPKRYIFLSGIFFLSQLCIAQTGLSQPRAMHTAYRNYPDYFEQITYNGKHQEYITVKTYLKDSTLYRIDNYKRIYEVNAYSYQRDTGKVTVRHGTTKIMYPSGQVYLSCDYKLNVLNGPFMIFYNDGTLKRREYYKAGRVRESHCYNQDETEQPWEPYYQSPRFTGDAKALKAYLEKNFATLIDGQSITNLKINVTINEIGQVINTAVLANQDSPRLSYAIDRVIRSMPRWNETSADWKPASIDGVPVSKNWVIYVYRKKSFLYISFS